MKQTALFKTALAFFAVSLITAGVAFDLELIKVFIAGAAGTLISAAVMAKTHRYKE